MERPILFSTPMVQAILAGRKTQTRRVVKQAQGWDPIWKPTLINETHLDGIPRYEMRTGAQYSLPFFKCPYGKVGDVLWVRETWAPIIDDTGDRIGFYHCTDTDIYSGPWKPSIHMPKAACRIFLRITNVRVERLQDISEEDAIAEGIGKDKKGWWQDYTHPYRAGYMVAKNSFRSLWHSINGEQSWKDNPWVWVVEFEKFKK